MRTRREAALVATLAAAATLQWGCASNAPKSAPRESPTPIGPGGTSERSDRGNPPFYDVLGRRYYVLSSSEGYRARGIASWYGQDFQGLSTSSGETYNMHALTAAHKTLPIPTWVEVTNLENGRRVVVKVNDRGPFVNNRLIDLSYAAARELDMIRGGTARVEIRAVASAVVPAPALTTARTEPSSGAGAPSALQPPPAAPPPTAHGGIALISSADAAELPTPPAQPLFAQIGAFSDGANAARLVDRLRSSGFAGAFVVSEADGRGTLHRVRVGPLRDEREFDQVRARLRSLGFGESHLVTAR